MDDCPTSLTTIKYLALTEEFLVDLFLDRPLLRPILFGYRSNIPNKLNYHSIVEEVAYERWDIAVYRKYLWDADFY